MSDSNNNNAEIILSHQHQKCDGVFATEVVKLQGWCWKCKESCVESIDIFSDNK